MDIGCIFEVLRADGLHQGEPLQVAVPREPSFVDSKTTRRLVRLLSSTSGMAEFQR